MKKSLLIIALLSILSGELLAQSGVNVFLIARTTGIKILANGDTVTVFGFAQDLGEQPSVPGPTIYANEGDSVGSAGV